MSVNINDLVNGLLTIRSRLYRLILLFLLLLIIIFHNNRCFINSR